MKNKKIATITILSILATLFVVLFVVIGITYAAYRNSLKAQRAIAPYDESGSKFSSNYLLNSDTNFKTIYTTSVLSLPQAVITVCNYEQGRQTQYFYQDITYSITITALKSDFTLATASDFSEDETIKFGDITLSKTNLSATISNETLTGGMTSSNYYKLIFSKYNSDLKVSITANPDHNLPILKGVFSPALRSEGAINSWNGSFSDDTSKPTSSYDGFNYIVSGFGTGTCRLKWNNEILNLSIASILEFDFGDVTTNGSESYIEFEVDSSDISRYDLQFYKVDITGTTWNDSQMKDSSSNNVVELIFR